MFVGTHGWLGLNFLSKTVGTLLGMASAGLIPQNQEGLSTNKQHLVGKQLVSSFDALCLSVLQCIYESQDAL